MSLLLTIFNCFASDLTQLFFFLVKLKNYFYKSELVIIINYYFYLSLNWKPSDYIQRQLHLLFLAFYCIDADWFMARLHFLSISAGCQIKFAHSLDSLFLAIFFQFVCAVHTNQRGKEGRSFYAKRSVWNIPFQWIWGVKCLPWCKTQHSKRRRSRSGWKYCKTASKRQFAAISYVRSFFFY